MSYRLMIVFRAGSYSGAALTSQVVGFDTLEEAETVRAQALSHNMPHMQDASVLRLYQYPVA